MLHGVPWDAISRATSWVPGQVCGEDQDSNDRVHLVITAAAVTIY